MTQWTCHAHPARLGGKECGHVNATRSTVKRWNGDHLVDLEYCAGCGCTKKASDDRLERKRAKTL